MFKRITLAALASTAILSFASLSPASAQHHSGMGGMHLGGGGMHHPGGGFHPGGFHPGGFHHPHHPRWWRWHWRHYPYNPVFVEPGYSTSYVAPTYATSAPAVATCPSNCLKKQYLEDGSVVFTDQCTNESATAPATAGSNG